MAFYTDIAPFYDDIFPVGDKQLEFIKQHIGKAPKQLIDIACGNGGYAVALAKDGYLVTALDSDNEMLVSAKEKANLENVEIATVNCKMDEMHTYITGQFDAAICIGNSLVHLDDETRVLDFLSQMKALLKPTGRGIIQIINYNKVLFHGMTSLPDITNEEKGLSFKREYTLKDNRILFHTKLEVGGEVTNHTIPLLPLVKDEVQRLIQEVDLHIVEVYGGYDGSSYDEATSMHYIAIVENC